MKHSGRLLLAAVVAGSAMLTSLSAEAFWGPFSFMRWGGWGDGWGYPGYGWGGYPGYGWGGYPGYGWGGYPAYGYGYGYPYGGWGSPYGYGWGAPYAYPTVAAPAAPAAPATSSAK
jgi:hypothetical protein